MDWNFENEFRSFKQQGEHTKMENRLATNDTSFTNYTQQIASCLKGEIDFKKLGDLSFKDAEAELEQVLEAQRIMLELHPKINTRSKKNQEIITTYAVDNRGDVFTQVPPSAPDWLARRMNGDDEQFRRKAKEMRRIQKKLEARGIKTQPIVPHNKPSM